MIMPVWFIFIYYLQIKHEFSYSHWIILPFSWFLYFYLGLKTQHKNIKMNWIYIIAIVVIGFVIEIVEMHILYSITQNTNFSVTPLRYSSILYVYGFVNIFLKLKNSNFINQRILKLLGDNSFGIYLLHMVILPFVVFFVKKIIDIEMYYLIYILMVLFITLLICNSVINLSNRYISAKYLRWIGFS